MLIPKHIFPIITAASTDDARPGIAGVQLLREGPGRARATVTDGHRLVTVKWAEPAAEEFPNVGVSLATKDDFSMIVPRAQWQQAGRNVPKAKKLPILANAVIDETAAGNGTANIVTLNDDHKPTTTSFAVPDVSYPEWPQILPREADRRKAHRIGVNARYMADLFKILAEARPNAHDDRTCAVILEVPASPTEPIRLWHRKDDVEAFAILMPVRVDDVDLEPLAIGADAIDSDTCTAPEPGNEPVAVVPADPPGQSTSPDPDPPHDEPEVARRAYLVIASSDHPMKFVEWRKKAGLDTEEFRTARTWLVNQNRVREIGKGKCATFERIAA